MKRVKQFAYAAAVAAIVGAANTGHAQESAALVDKLVEKGVLTESEADEVKSGLVEEFTKSPAGKFDGGKLASKVTLFGDLRLRYEYTDSQNAFDQKDDGKIEPNGADNRDDRSRSRYRLRFGIKTAFKKELEFGLRLATGNALEEITSTNETMGDAFAKDGIYVDQAYLKYTPKDWLTIWGGKYDQQFWTTDMLWDSDVTVEGATEMFNYKVGKAEFFANFGQWVFGDVNESDEDRQDTGGNQKHGFDDDGSKQVTNDDGWIFAAQGGVKYTFTDKIDTRIAAGYHYYANSEDMADGQKTTSSGIVFPSPGSGNNLGNEFQLVDVLFEANIKPFSGSFEKINIRPYAHWILNTAPAPNLGVTSDIKGDHSTGNSASNNDDIRTKGDDVDNFVDISDDTAWRVGLDIGTGNKVKGDWLIGAYYQEVGSDSVPDTFNDSDFAGGFTNSKGYVIKASYLYRDWWSFNASLLDADILDPDIQQDTAKGNATQNRTVQLDTVVKF